MIFLINTALGFLIAQLVDIKSRQKTSQASPTKFNFAFFVKDNKYKILVSILLSFSISTALWLNWNDWLSADPEVVKWGNLFYLVIGFSPDFAIAYFKKRTGFLQPTTVSSRGKEYDRKSNG